MTKETEELIKTLEQRKEDLELFYENVRLGEWPTHALEEHRRLTEEIKKLKGE